MLKLAIQIDFFGSKNKNQHEYSIFLPQSILMFTPLDPAINASFSSDSSIESLKSSLVNILESSYEPVLDTCSIILNSFETSSIIRSSFGVVSEVYLMLVCDFILIFRIPKYTKYHQYVWVSIFILSFLILRHCELDTFFPSLLFSLAS